MPITSAPGKIILFGEHAVVYGQPAVALAVDLRLKCRIYFSEDFLVNGWKISRSINPYISAAIDKVWRGPPLSIYTESSIPSGSGLGSSAAVSVALTAGLMHMRGGFTEREVAELAFEVESEVQGRASPIDTSVSSHGYGIFIDRKKGEDFLWMIERDTLRWYIHHIPIEKMTFVIGYTGIHAPTGPLVEKVRTKVERDEAARTIIEEIGSISEEGLRALRCGDTVKLGDLMNRNHELLSSLGVSSNALEKLVRASRPYAYGAKLTGAGGGGSMIALTDTPDRVCDAIKSAGGEPIIARAGAEGVRIEQI